MKIRLTALHVRTRESVEKIEFAKAVTYLHGPIGTGKSTVARLIDYCFGGKLEETPAIQREFVSSTLYAKIGDYVCALERSATDNSSVRVTWDKDGRENYSLNAPLVASDEPLMDADVYNLSDLLFYFFGIEPIRVPKKSRDPDSDMIRLSFRDIWRYCYLDQAHLDSSFFRLEDPFRGRKSQDAMRFFTGLHSERLSTLQREIYKTSSEQSSSRTAAEQLRAFMKRVIGRSEMEIEEAVGELAKQLQVLREQRDWLEKERVNATHPVDVLRAQLRRSGASIASLQEAVDDSREMLHEQVALRAELFTAKLKATRAEQAGRVLDGVEYADCPQCGSDISDRPPNPDACRLCGTATDGSERSAALDPEVIQRDFNERIDQLSQSINRREQSLGRTLRQLENVSKTKSDLDAQLHDELSRYDSAFVEQLRSVDRDIAMLEERAVSLSRFREVSRSIGQLEETAAAAQGKIKVLRSAIDSEKLRLRSADENIRAIESKFKDIMISVGFPGVQPTDKVVINSSNWKPVVEHSGQSWGFWDTGSGGKKVLFNVCYALAVHEVARERGMPVPNLLIIDSPTKNISDDENLSLVEALYAELYKAADVDKVGSLQLLLIDSDLFEPSDDFPHFRQRRMAGSPGEPGLIAYYKGP